MSSKWSDIYLEVMGYIANKLTDKLKPYINNPEIDLSKNENFIFGSIALAKNVMDDDIINLLLEDRNIYNKLVEQEAPEWYKKSSHFRKNKIKKYLNQC